LDIVTGQNLAELSRAYFPQPVVCTTWVCREMVAMASDLAEFLGALYSLVAYSSRSGQCATWLDSTGVARSLPINHFRLSL
jgi:hypothetical protein